MLNKIKYEIRKEAYESLSSCEKLSQMPLEAQHERLNHIMSDQGLCLQCQMEDYSILDTETCDNINNKSSVCMCYHCRNMLDITWERGTFRILEVADLGYLPDNQK